MKKNSLLKYFRPFNPILISIFLTGGCQATQISGFTPGVYDNAIVGFDDEKKIVTGYFSETSSDESRPSMRCQFYFSGKLTGSKAQLKIYQLTLKDKPTAGTLRVEHNEKGSSINLQLEEEQPGCMNIYPKIELAKTKLSFVSPAKWIEIRMASEKKVYFYKDIVAGTKTKIYITKGDVVGVLEYKGEWAKVVYTGETKSTVGWVKVTQLFTSVKFSMSQL